MKAPKVLRDNTSESLTVTWDGEAFGIIQEDRQKKVTKVITLYPREMLELIKFAASFGKGNEIIEAGNSETPKKVTIEPQNILDFVGDLGEAVAEKHIKLRPRKLGEPRKLGKKEEKQLRVIANIVTLAISRGLILANYQSELAAALVKHMNQVRPGYADFLLKEILFYHYCFLVGRGEVKGQMPPELPMPPELANF